jgi:signal transduction histidine kinase
MIAVGGLGAVMCAITAYVTATGTATGDVALESTVRALVVGLPIGVGVFAWRQPASARFGRNLTLTGVLYFVVSLASSENATVHSLGRVAGWLAEAWIVYLALSFPSGRLPGRADRVIVTFLMVVVVVLYLPTAVLVDHYPSPSPYSSCIDDCPANAFQLTGSEPAFIEAWERPLREVLTILVFVAMPVRLAMRMSAASALLRQAIAPVLLVAAARLATLALAIGLRAADAGNQGVVVGAWLLNLGIPAITIAFLVGLLRWRLYVGSALARLARHTGSDASADDLRRALADAFRDPDLQILLRREQGGWLDGDGGQVTPPVEGSGRMLTEVRESGRPVAAVVHDEALRDEPAFIDAAATHALATLENQRLAARTAALLREVEDSRARLAASADDERRRLERDLHDGAQQRLVALRLRLGLAEELLARDHARGAELVRQLGPEAEAALEEIRALARGVYPPPLVDHGLAAALRSAALRSPLPVAVIAQADRRYPQHIEAAAYFCGLEALQNAAKHATASRVTVLIAEAGGSLRLVVTDDGQGFDPDRVERGAGLTNLEDRARAVGGDVTIESQPGAGTRIEATIPL